MSEHEQFEGTPNSQATTKALAHWLQQVMQTLATDAPSITATIPPSELSLGNGYHPAFQQQLPDFVMALLSHDAQATLHYAPLMFHLAGCRDCHTSYRELYATLREVVQPSEPRPLLGQGTRTLNAMPPRMLSHLCQVLIKQAEALLYQERHEYKHEQSDTVTAEAARSLMQIALRVSAYIAQSTVRRQALHDLVRVASLADGAPSPASSGPNVYSYTPTLSGAGGVRGKKIVRRADTSRSAQQEQPIIHIQARTVEGYITQNGSMLELHLQDLNEHLRGKHIEVSIPLGSLLEPVRWLGGDPRHLRSTIAVDANGAIVMPLGETPLNLTIHEEYHLLEAMFLLLEVRAVED